MGAGGSWRTPVAGTCRYMGVWGCSYGAVRPREYRLGYVRPEATGPWGPWSYEAWSYRAGAVGLG